MKDSHEEHSLYTASYTDIFFKNFLIGFARGLGGFAVNIVFLIFIYYSFMYFVMPKIEPFLNAFVKAQETIGKISNPSGLFDGFFQDDQKQLQLDSPKQTR